MIGPDRVGDDTYRIVEATMMNNAKRIITYDWYQAAWHTGTTIPSYMQMRNYGREAALAYTLEGDTITAAVTKATKHMYHYAYDEARGYIKHAGGERDRCVAVTSLVDTQTTLLNEHVSQGTRGAYRKLQYRDNHRWFETADLISRLDATGEEKGILSLIALGYSTKEIAESVGLKRTTLVMRLPKLMERIREQCRTAINSD